MAKGLKMVNLTVAKSILERTGWTANCETVLEMPFTTNLFARKPVKTDPLSCPSGPIQAFPFLHSPLLVPTSGHVAHLQNRTEKHPGQAAHLPDRSEKTCRETFHCFLSISISAATLSVPT